MDIRYEDILNSVKEWIWEFVQSKPLDMTYEIIHDRQECFRIIFHFSKNCLGEIVVSNADSFTYYRYVKFEVLGFTSESDQSVYLWYDSDKEELADILTGLNNGIEIVMSWIATHGYNTGDGSLC